VNIFPDGKFKAWYEDHRPIGVGVMGFADALMRFKIAYGSGESTSFADLVMQTIRNASYLTSEELAVERGYPAHAGIVGRRNITTVSIAPTGSIAFIAGCSHGIEPIFSPVYKRTDERGEEYLFKHPNRYEDFFRSSINEKKDMMPTWREHLDIQSAMQSNVDSGVSKTINMVNGVTQEDVLEAMKTAWLLGCKGITVYRDGSRQIQVLEDLKEEDSLLIDCPSGVCDL
jgi:ribonucleoside-diphosphate reductase alpha chain